MAHSLRSLILLTTLAAALVGRTCAAGPPVDHAVAFTVFASEPLPCLSYLAEGGAGSVPLALFPTARSARAIVRGANGIRFVDHATGRELAVANIDPALAQCLVLFSRNGKDADARAWQVRVLDDGAKAHPDRALRIVNLSGLTLAGAVGGQAVTLRPGDDRKFPGKLDAKVELRTEWRGRSHPALAETIRAEGNIRVLLLLLPPWRRGALEPQWRVLRDAGTGESR